MKSMSYYNDMIKTAAESAGVEQGEMRGTLLRRDGDEYEISFHTEWMDYTVYIGIGGEVSGFLAEPVDEHSFEETHDAEIIPFRLAAV